MSDDQPNVRDAKLIQYLNEAYGNEKRLETALQSHIEMAVRVPYRKRLSDHLTETKRHARELERRIKQLGGSAEEGPIHGPSGLVDIAGVVVSGMQKATALAAGPLHALRGTGAEERQLKNAKTEYAEEAQEIGTYSAIQTFAEKVGDRDTATLARAILREEQRMATFLEKEIAHLANAVATAEVPARLRNGAATRRRRASSRRSGAAASSRRSGAAASSRRSGAAASSRRSGAAASSRRSGAAASSRRSGAAASSGRSGSSASSGRSGSAASRGSGARSRTTSRSGASARGGTATGRAASSGSGTGRAASSGASARRTSSGGTRRPAASASGARRTGSSAAAR
jgi:ferritin-like metal-binding protein YciE